MKSPDAYIVLLKPYAEGAKPKIIGTRSTITAARKLAANPGIKLKPLDMLIAGRYEIINILILEESPLSIYVVDPKGKIRKAVDLVEEVAGEEYNNWIAAWASSDKADGMAYMCQYIDQMTRIRVAAEITRALVSTMHAPDGREDQAQAYISKIMAAKTPKQALSVPWDPRKYSEMVRRLRFIIEDAGDSTSLFTLVETYFVYSYQRPGVIADIIRTYVPLPAVLLGAHLKGYTL